LASSIHYPIAKDENNKWVKISEAQRCISYFCPECGTPFVLRLGSIRVHHFAHKPGYQGECTGESGYHNLAKHLLAHYFDEKRAFTLSSKCTVCSREFSREKRIIDIQVEKGTNNYRPDVKLLLEEDNVIDCEIVYKNPLADKLKVYKERKSNLLVWEIDKEVKEVPYLTQLFWEEENEWRYKFENHEYNNRLLLLASPKAPQHECTAYGTAIISRMICWKCGASIKVVKSFHWYPKWSDLDENGSYVPFNSVPSQFISKLNKQAGTDLREDYSKTMHQKYIMNHCSRCHVKIGNFFMHESEGEDRVFVDFELTAWERNALSKWQSKQRTGSLKEGKY
jgi:hypothetical protein